MSVRDQLAPGSFRKVSFFISDTRTEGGRKTVTHEFVNSNNRSTEDLGKMLKKFRVTGVVVADEKDPTGATYFTNRDNLIGALERKGKATLQHPFFGEISVVAKPYTLTEDLSKLGVATFVMEFEVASDTVQPFRATSSSSQTLEKTIELNGFLVIDVSDSFIVSDNAPESYKKAKSLLERVAESFKVVNEAFDTDTEAVAEFNTALQNFTGAIVPLIDNPARLAEAVLDLFNTLDNVLVDDLTQALNIYKNFFDFNTTSPTIGISTDVGNAISEEAAEIITNEQGITLQVRTTSLSYAYGDVALVEFTNVEDLEDSQATLEIQFQALYEDQTTSSEVKESLQELGDTANKFFEEQKLTINDVTEIDIKRMPAQVLTYALYGSLDNAQAIIDLNGDPDVSFYDGTVRALTE